MGFPMAANLRKKIPKESALYINDVDANSVERFVKEYSSYGPVEILGTAKEVAEKAVRLLDCAPTDPRMSSSPLCPRDTMFKMST
jgi:hypothetical protein